MVSKKLTVFLTFGSSRFIAASIYAVFWLFLASLIPKTEYGEIGFIMSIVNVAAAISILGLESTVMVFEPKKENVFPASFVVVLISSSIAGIIVYFLTQNVFPSILIVGLNVFIIVLAGLNSEKRYDLYSFHFISRAIIAVVASILLYHLFGINGILFGYFISSLLIIRELFRLIKKNKINFSVLKSKLKFTTEMMITRSSRVGFNWGDKVLIGILFGFSVVGGYYFAFQYFLLMSTFSSAVGIYLIPLESEGKRNKKLKIISIGIASLIVVISIVLVPYGVNMILPEYQESILPMQIMSAAIIPLSISFVQEAEFLGRAKSRIVLFGTVIQSGLYLLLIIFLGGLYGLTGMAIGLLIAFIVRNVFNLIAKWRTEN